ncbi:MAG: hypothetical protein NZ888_05995 [Candidatus Nitrosocaldus sp.]|nr:hypothetical protein [Candidatus Nitrosocaldus sp.]MDW8000799.1 hypothetical protein [Candidatus Nitrosocaldus sp.]
MSSMGVYHISGLGRSPGALSVPLTTVYLLQLGQHMGFEDAERFFQYSGEMEGDGSHERIRGLPECIIVFTSAEVISGPSSKCKSDWFNLSFESTKLDKIYGDFFGSLFTHMEHEFGFKASKFRFYLVKVNHTDFEDCFKKVGITMRCLERKEVWANMIGGSNQINAAILSAGAYAATVSNYYYIFQDNIQLLEPEFVEKPKRNSNIQELIERAMSRWYTLPIFNIDIGRVLRSINELFEGRRKINVKEIENALEELGYGKGIIPKLRRMLVFKGDTVERGDYFIKLYNIWTDIEETNIRNLSEWKKWCEGEGILTEMDVFG